MTTLDRYVLGAFLRMLPLCIAAAATIFLLFDFFLHIGEFAEYESNIEQVFAYFVFKAPRIVSQIYPAATLFAVLVGIGTLTEQREVLAMQACGVSVLRLLAPLALAGAVVSVLVLAWNETVVPPAASRARFIRNVEIQKRLQAGVFDASSIWFRSNEGFFHIQYFDAAANVLFGIMLYEVDDALRPIGLLESPKAIWKESRWRFSQGSVTTLGAEGGGLMRSSGEGELRLDIPPEELRSKRRRAYEFSYGELRRQVRTLEANGLDVKEYAVDLQAKLAWPFSGLVSIGLALPITVRSRRRGGGILRNVLMGLAVSFVYWSITALSLAAGHAGTLSPIVAAWAPNVAFAAVAAALCRTAAA